MKEELKIILILRPIKVSPMSFLNLFSVSDKDGLWFDFEYELDLPEDRLVDGYEVNIFESIPQSLPKSNYSPKFSVEKKFLLKSFIGDRNPGDVGLLSLTTNLGSITAEYKFSKETMNNLFPLVYSFYINVNNGDFNSRDLKYPLGKEGLSKLMDLLTVTNRDMKINGIL